MSSSVSVICSTLPLTARGSPENRVESGSDFISRGITNTYRVVFPSGVTMATCDVKVSLFFLLFRKFAAFDKQIYWIKDGLHESIFLNSTDG